MVENREKKLIEQEKRRRNKEIEREYRNKDLIIEEKLLIPQEKEYMKELKERTDKEREKENRKDQEIQSLQKDIKDKFFKNEEEFLENLESSYFAKPSYSEIKKRLKKSPLLIGEVKKMLFSNPVSKTIRGGLAISLDTLWSGAKALFRLFKIIVLEAIKGDSPSIHQVWEETFSKQFRDKEKIKKIEE